MLYLYRYALTKKNRVFRVVNKGLVSKNWSLRGLSRQTCSVFTKMGPPCRGSVTILEAT